MEIDWTAVTFMATPFIGGVYGGMVTKRNLLWYAELKRPPFTPPNWAFSPIWTTLYSSMGYASYIVYKDGGGFSGTAKWPLIIYGSNVLANWTWTTIFFEKKNMKMAFCELQFINATALTMSYLFYRINHKAGLLILPYIGWLAVSTALTYSFWQENQADEKKVEDMEKTTSKKNSPNSDKSQIQL
ncbi:translocator protein-like [Diorhabda carinulata]|uniref:translocator protein-like n=1 Tax=Diorhabda carinulata TaxID=1163345 RepID=UPI0025A12A8B|nr:translocator protein-like [Diorhabda carinulata]